MVERESGTLIGNCGLIPYRWEEPEIELGYRLGRRWWRRGYATEAASACLRFAFGELGLERVVAVTDPDNVASQRVLAKIGMARGGTDRYGGSDVFRYSPKAP